MLSFRSLLLLASFLAPLAGLAQESASDRTTREICECLQALGPGLSDEAFKDQGMTCFVGTFTQNMTELAQEYGIGLDELNEDTGRQIGEKLGIKMAGACDESLRLLLLLGSQGVKEGNVNPERAPYLQSGETSGKFLRLETAGEIVKLVLSVEGEEESFYWLRPFLGSDLLERDYKKLAGKTVTLQWGLYEQYSFSLKGYGKRREITLFRVEE
jgi:hypothetical protein